MRPALLVARREIFSVLRSRAFLFTTFGAPLLVALLSIGVFEVISDTVMSPAQVQETGFVDAAGIVSQDEPFRRLISVAAARAAQEAGELDAWFLIPAGYMDSGAITLYSRAGAGEALENAIDAFLRANLAQLADSRLPPERLAQPVEFHLRVPGRELGDENLTDVLVLQLFYALAFFIALQATSGYLISSVVEEKSSRMLEMLVTSLSPLQLMLGKILGLACVGLTQLGVWLGFALTLRATQLPLPFLDALQLPPAFILVTLVYFLLSYFLVAAIFVGIGSISDSEQESRQLAAMLTLITVIPFMAYGVLLAEPDGTISVALTLFPLTAPLAAIIRLNLGSLPAWQLALSLALLALSLLAAVPLAARLFRLSLLLHGARPTLRRLWRNLRRATPGRQRA